MNLISFLSYCMACGEAPSSEVLANESFLAMIKLPPISYIFKQVLSLSLSLPRGIVVRGHIPCDSLPVFLADRMYLL